MNLLPELTLALCIEKELVTYINHFTSYQEHQPILVFPGHLNTWFSKAIRYFALMHNLAAIYINVDNFSYLVVFHQEFFKSQHLLSYIKFYKFLHEDMEQIETFNLYSVFLRCSLSLSTMFGPTPLDGKNVPPDCIMIVLQKADLGVISKHSTETASLPKARSNINIKASQFFFSEFFSPCVQFQVINLPPACTGLMFPPKIIVPRLSMVDEEIPDSSQLKLPYIANLNECSAFMTKLTSLLTKPPFLVYSTQEYSVYETFCQCVLNNVIEAYDIPIEYTTNNVLAFFPARKMCLKWCDDSRAIIIFADCSETRLLRVNSTMNFKVRTMDKASPLAMVVVSLIDLPKVIQRMNCN